MKQMNVAILGVGVVGRSVIEILQENKDIIRARTGVEIVPKLAIARNIKNKKTTIPLSTNIEDALNDESIDMIVELIGGVELPYEIALKALKSGKSLVTANKAMLAYHRHELERLEKKMQEEFLKKSARDSKDSKDSKDFRAKLDSKNIESKANLDSKKAKNLSEKKEKTPPQIGFEASVCGGIPIIRILRDGLCANHILSIRGIMNGTSNYILSKMSSENASFEVALKEAQKLGYAEADPTLDINGSDSAHKLLILASLAYRIDAKVQDILIEGIEGIKLADIEFAKDYDYEIKLLGIAKKIGNKLSLRVHLTLIPKDCMLAKVNGAMNALSVVGDKVGESLYYGAGAGGAATASSVVSDIMEIARSKTSPMLGYVDTFESEKVRLDSKENITCKYYIRLSVADGLGVLAKITSILAREKISIESLMQKSEDSILVDSKSSKNCNNLGFEVSQDCENLDSKNSKNHNNLDGKISQDSKNIDSKLCKDSSNLDSKHYQDFKIVNSRSCKDSKKIDSKNLDSSLCQDSNITNSHISKNSKNLDSKLHQDSKSCKDSKNIDSQLHQDSTNLDSKNIKTALLLFATHTCNEKQIQKALKALQNLPEVLSPPFMIRIEEM